MARHARTLLTALLLGAGLATAVPLAAPRVAAANDLERADMTVTPVLTGLGSGLPVAARFAPDGRIYVAFKQGVVRMYDGPGDTTPIETLNLAADVNSYGDRGLLGLALDPDFDSGRPYLYVLYTLDLDPYAPDPFPRWNDGCPSPPGANTDGCVVSGRVDRYTVGADGRAVGASLVRLLDGASTSGGGWCNQFPSHSIGTLAFGADKRLYVGAGDGASYTAADYGQFGGSAGSPTPKNPCDDRDDAGHGRGASLVPASSRGGALRSQSVRSASPSGYQSWDGAILRIDPDTGAAPADNPLAGGDPSNDRIVAYGLRNPYRFTFAPGTNELRLGDVGWNRWEEINTFTAGPDQTEVPNFGWPCYEGAARQGNYDGLDLGLCESLYTDPVSTIDGVTSPLTHPEYAWIRYGQRNSTLPGLPPPPNPTIPCTTTSGGGSATGGQFAANADWPADIRGAYVFGDYSRPCIVAMALGADGNPDPNRVLPLVRNVGVIDIQVGPGGDIYYVDFMSSTLWRLRPLAGNVPPVPSFTAVPESGALDVTFDASATTDANEGEALTYEWDLDGDGACDDATGVTATWSYAAAAAVTVTVCVSDGIDMAEAERTIHPGLVAPVIDAVTSSSEPGGWAVEDTVDLVATAHDPDIVPPDAALPASAYEWSLDIRHCPVPTDCHTHLLEVLDGPAVQFVAPDHEYYAYIRATLTVTDADGLRTSRAIDLLPRPSRITIATQPPGVVVSTGSSSGPSPLTADFLEGGVAELAVPPSTLSGGRKLRFAAWADQAGAPRLRTISAPAGASIFTARYEPVVTVASVTPTVVGADDRPLPVTVVADVVDDVETPGMTATLTGPDGRTTTGALARISGSASRGRWQGLVTLPAGWPVGSTTVRVDATGAMADGKWAIGPAVHVVAVAPPGEAGILPLTPRRVLDTRIGLGAAPGRVDAGGERRVQITGLAGVPAATTAVVANLTIVHTGAPGYATAFPCGQRPEVSNLNAGPDETVANLATVPLDADGGLCVYTSVEADLLVDLAGVVVDGAGGHVGAPPRRVVDTRVGAGAELRRLAAGEELRVPLAALAAPGASAVVTTLTVTEPAAAGYLSAYPCGGTVPVASNLNFAGGQTIANAAVTALGADGDLCLIASADTNVIVDVSGWIAPGGSAVRLAAPSRVLDTRSAAPIAAGETVQLGWAPGAGREAVIANVTATQAAASGYLTVYPCATGMPATSNLNYGAGRDRPGLVIVELDAAGEVCIYASATTHVLVDVQGWIVRPTTG